MSTLLHPAAASAGSGRVIAPRGRRRALIAAAVAGALAGLMLVGGAGSAQAHSWAGWHWNRGGSYVPVNVWNYASTSAIAEAARADIHARPHPVYLLNQSYHTDVSVFDAYEPGATYCGLAEIINYSYPHILHAHARYNTACGGSGGALPNYAQGVYCQEIAHTLGLDHSDTGDCMGLGYFAGSNGRYCFGVDCSPSGYSHPTGDLTSMYRWHTVTASLARAQTQLPADTDKDRDAPPAGYQAPHVSAAPNASCPADMPANVSATWRFKPKSLAEVRSTADSIVLAKVVSVKQGPDNVLTAPEEPGGEVRTPTQLVTFSVKKAYKGSARADASVTISKLGGPCYKVDEDPAYAQGETDLLMLERGPRGLQVVSPEGRYTQASNGTLKPVVADDVTAAARGQRPGAVAR